jgi:hypothetical protein
MGQFSSNDEQAIFEWVALNTDALVEYREGRIALDGRFLGLGRQIEESMAVAVDGEIFQDTYLAPLNPDSEISTWSPKIGGG